MLSLLVLDKHFDTIMPYFEEIIKVPTFPEEQFNIYIEKEVQKHKISMQKTSYNAARTFMHNIYKANCRAGRVMDMEKLKNIKRNDLVNFHNQKYAADTLDIFISGQPSQKTIDNLCRAFENWDKKSSKTKPVKIEFSHKTGRVELNVKGAQQATIHMGCPFVPVGHEDAVPMYILNTILGGYFGSRLMTNIREEKGLTYSIGSVVSCTKDNGLIRIISNVKPEMYNLVVDEIFKEMKHLKDEPVSQEELNLVINFMKGTMLTRYDSVITTMDTVIPYFIEGAGITHDKQLYDEMARITPTKIQYLANKYYNDNFLTVIAK